MLASFESNGVYLDYWQSSVIVSQLISQGVISKEVIEVSKEIGLSVKQGLCKGEKEVKLWLHNLKKLEEFK